MTGIFISTGQAVNYSQEKTVAMMSEMKQKTERVIEEVQALIPENFPLNISEPIFSGLRRQAAKLP
ncbi:hypothetical protein Ppb6_03365 [Photorhabdus australis subsp. thailandensis]|uniref:Uncharacterized protein n=1 Tax=Photorhabdus australis subsp. thailandensis TaxID=2805096 RepID=A0A1C0U0J6_9GAMM|nr:hypothetical protein [Photorhabdus australis]OCQ51448.1 hypothetical protein Ppb6_03365 [Photorhabdus australis subsp. thailandensis]